MLICQVLYNFCTYSYSFSPQNNPKKETIISILIVYVRRVGKVRLRNMSSQGAVRPESRESNRGLHVQLRSRVDERWLLQVSSGFMIKQM